MHPEVKNLGLLAKHSLKLLTLGKFAEAATVARVIGIRAGETIAEGASGTRGVTCDFCGWSGRAFRTYTTGGDVRPHALCPKCLCLERHRDFIRTFRLVRPLLAERIRVLDIAPTLAFTNYCRADASIEYLSVDRVSPIAMKHMDVQNLELPSDHFDVVVCCHVLDYVPDDVRALSELRRVLRPNGVAILQEGLEEQRATEEWPAPRPDRHDRIRQYGRDFRDRVRKAGLHFVEAVPDRDVIFVAVKDAQSPLLERVTSAVASLNAQPA